MWALKSLISPEKNMILFGLSITHKNQQHFNDLKDLFE